MKARGLLIERSGGEGGRAHSLFCASEMGRGIQKKKMFLGIALELLEEQRPTLCKNDVEAVREHEKAIETFNRGLRGEERKVLGINTEERGGASSNPW